MPGSTAILALPYPLATEPVSQGDDAIKALAEAVDAYIASGNTTMSSSGAGVNAAAVVAYRRAKFALFNVNLSTTAALASGAILFVVPAGYRPPAGVTIFGTLVDSGSGATIRVHFEAAGNVTVQQAVASGVTVRGSVTVPL